MTTIWVITSQNNYCGQGSEHIHWVGLDSETARITCNKFERECDDSDIEWIIRDYQVKETKIKNVWILSIKTSKWGTWYIQDVFPNQEEVQKDMDNISKKYPNYEMRLEVYDC